MEGVIRTERVLCLIMKATFSQNYLSIYRLLLIIELKVWTGHVICSWRLGVFVSESQ